MTPTTFLLKDYQFSRADTSLSLFYAYENGPSFEEKIYFPAPEEPLSAEQAAALDRACRLIFLLAGVSYYKAYIPSLIVCRAFALDGATARFCEEVYRQGLGEFAHRNGVELNFRFKTEDIDGGLAPVSLPRSNKALVPVGGGKDSIVTLETLKRAKRSTALFALGGEGALAEPIAKTIEVSGLPFFHVRRVLSPNLFALNKLGALNGHVPITAILSAIAVACAIMQRCDAVVMSNERSASQPNVVKDGREINHQYSKSLAFEELFADYVRRSISGSIDYFSFLRPLSEAAIAQRFAAFDAYHEAFRSCNASFKQDEEKRAKAWCCACPKCRFVFLALAPYMPKEKLVSLFGMNLLSRENQKEGYEELCGLSGHKPFECVGETEESALLMLALSRKEDWRNDYIVFSLGLRLSVLIDKFEEKTKMLLELSNQHRLPVAYWEMLKHATDGNAGLPLDQWGDKRVLIWGVGREAHAAAQLLLMKMPGLNLSFVDENEKATLPQDLLNYPLICGSNQAAWAVSSADIIVKSPGVSLYHPLIEEAKARGVIITSLLNMWFELSTPSKAKTIVVTGTKGKSTTASLIAHVLNGLRPGSAQLVGNIGVPVTQCNLSQTDYAVIEVSSYQAANFRGSCDIGVLVSLFPEHLNWHLSVKQYYADKINLLNHCRIRLCERAALKTIKSFQLSSQDFLAYNDTQRFHFEGNIVYDGAQMIGALHNDYLLRVHNKQNVCSALAVVKALGLDLAPALACMESFRGLAHRQQELGIRFGLLFVDDSISTTPQSAIAALQSYFGRSVTIIVGGQDRGVDYSPLTDYLALRDDVQVLCLGENGPAIHQALIEKGGVVSKLVSSMKDAVDEAKIITPQGGVVLLSPAAPSFDMFRDYIDRAEAFDFASREG